MWGLIEGFLDTKANKVINKVSEIKEYRQVENNIVFIHDDNEIEFSKQWIYDTEYSKIISVLEKKINKI